MVRDTYRDLLLQLEYDRQPRETAQQVKVLSLITWVWAPGHIGGELSYEASEITRECPTPTQKKEKANSKSSLTSAGTNIQINKLIFNKYNSFEIPGRRNLEYASCVCRGNLKDLIVEMTFTFLFQQEILVENNSRDKLEYFWISQNNEDEMCKERIKEFKVMGGDKLEDIGGYWINQFYSF